MPTTADSSFALLGIGGAHVDRIGHVTGHYHPGASNPGHLTSSVGGGALNALRNARLRGVAPVGLISARGGDHDGAIVGDTIDKAGIADMSAVFLDRRTASYTAILESGGDQIAGLADMDIYETALPRQLRRKALRDAIASAKALLVDANLPVPALRAVCDMATAPVFAIAISPAKAERLLAVAGEIDTVFMNRREMEAVSSGTDTAGLSGLAARGFSRAVVTGGSGPVLVLDGVNRFTVSQPEVNDIADVTGAGDALAGATVAALLQTPGIALAEAVREGIAAAQMTIRTVGPVAERLTGTAFEAIRERTEIRALAAGTEDEPT